MSNTALQSILRQIDRFQAELERERATLPQDPAKAAFEEFRTKLAASRNDLAVIAGVPAAATSDQVADFIRRRNEAAARRPNPLRQG